MGEWTTIGLAGPQLNAGKSQYSSICRRSGRSRSSSNMTEMGDTCCICPGKTHNHPLTETDKKDTGRSRRWLVLKQLDESTDDFRMGRGPALKPGIGTGMDDKWFSNRLIFVRALLFDRKCRII